MIDPFQIATQGIGPGWSTFGFATQGFGFEVEVIIQPATGGGGVVYPDLWDNAQPYEIIVRVKYKGKVWEEHRYISALMAKSLEKVMASFRRMNTSIIEVFGKLNNIITSTISVFAKRK